MCVKPGEVRLPSAQRYHVWLDLVVPADPPPLQPSPAERWYWEEMQAELTQAAEMASRQARAVELAGRDIQRARADAHRATVAEGGNMGRYEQDSFRFGPIETTRSDSVGLELSGEFGTALSLLARVTIERPTSPASDDPIVFWRLEDSLDGDWWAPLKQPGDRTSYRICRRADPSAGVRLSAPFANRVRVAVSLRQTAHIDSDLIRGTIASLTISVATVRL